MYELARKYDLYLPDAAILEGLVSLCKKSKDEIWRGSHQELANYVRSKRMTVSRSLKYLEEEGIVVKEVDGYRLAQNVQANAQNEQKKAQNEQKEERSKEEKVNKKESSVSKDDTNTQTLFFDYWKLASPNGEYNSYKAAAIKNWNSMQEEWRKLAVERVVNKLPERNAYYYLVDEDFLRESPAVSASNYAGKKNTSPEWLSNEQQYSLLQDGEVLKFCKRPGGGFGTVTKEDAETFGLEVVRDVSL